MGETYYDVLGVDPDATRAEIRAAYRERVLETHPDQSDDPDAADRFALVSEAESVLTDETERARYDRLGHRAYQRWGDGFPAATANADDASTAEDASTADGRTRSTTGSGGSSHDSPRDGQGDDGGASSREEGRDRARAGARGRRRSTGSGRRTQSSGPTGSHHARQRYRRRAATATEADWWFGEDGEGSTDSQDGAGATATAASGASAANAGAGGTAGGARSSASRSGSVAGSAAGARRTAAAGFGVGDAGSGPADAATGTDTAGDGFAVHGWTGDVDVDSPFQPLTRRSAFFLGCIWALYPLLVYSSLTPAFSLVVNAVVAACTLLLVGYLLTWPRVAMASFGFWSALVPVVLFPEFGLAALSLYGSLVWAAFWVPFVLGTTVWWTLRP